MNFLQDLAIVMIVAAVVTLIFHRLKQPVVLGYILAGVIVGPHTPPFPLISEQATIETISELGVIFLMFSLGLEFSLRKLRTVGATAFVAASFEILLMVWIGYEIGRLFGWNNMDSVFLGAILSISSTTIIIKALEALGKTKEPFAEIIFGVLIVEDILAIVMLALLSGFATTGSLSAHDVGRTVGELGAFLIVLLVVGLITVPRLLNYAAKFKSNEMLVVMVIGLCFGVSLLAAKLGYSVALGAFLIGAIIAESRQIGRIETLVLPIRDLFSAVFFVSIGLLIDPAMLVQYAGPILVISAAVVVGKVLACTAGTFVAGNDLRSSLRIGMGLAQIGEFSFIIATLGLSLKVTSPFLYPIAVAVSVVTTLLTPYLMRGSDGLVNWFDRRAPRVLIDGLDDYTLWIGRIARGSGAKSGPGGKFLRRWTWQIGLNMLLIGAVFVAALAARGPAAQRWPDIPGGREGLKALLWLGAMVLSLPMLIAVVRKLGAVGLLVGEMSVSRETGGANTGTLRAVIGNVVVIGGYVGICLCVLLLSSALLPSWNVLGFLGGLLVVLTILLRRAFIRLHARAQGALQDTFSQPPAPRHHVSHDDEPVVPLPSLLRHAVLRNVQIEESSPAAGKMLAEMRLRTLTGASVIGIERGAQNIVNPEPDELLQPGDQILLLGSEEQLETAHAVLVDGRSPLQFVKTSPPQYPAGPGPLAS